MEAQVIVSSASVVVSSPFALELPEPGVDLCSFLERLAYAYPRAASPGDLMEYARMHPDIAHRYPFVSVIYDDGTRIPIAVVCLWDYGHAVTFEVVRPDRPFLLGIGWLKGCRVLMASR